MPKSNVWSLWQFIVSISQMTFIMSDKFAVVCHLESSGRWPDDLEAIHHIKAAFHIKLADLLHKQCHLVTAATATHVFVALVRKISSSNLFLVDYYCLLLSVYS